MVQWTWSIISVRPSRPWLITRGDRSGPNARRRQRVVRSPVVIYGLFLREEAMSRVRVLVGTRKGAFVLNADGKREQWEVSGPHFGGWEVYHLKGSPVDPNRIYASQCSGWFGQLIQRSNDGGKTWEAVGNTFVYDGVPGTHKWHDGTPHPWEFKRA